MPEKDKILIEQLKSFSDTVIRLASEHDLANLLELILGELRSYTKADAGSLYIKEKNFLIFRVAHNDTLEATDELKEKFKQKTKSFSLPINEKSLAGYCALKKQTLNIPDVPYSPYHNPDMDKKFGYPVISMLVVPMITHSGELVGVLQLMNAKNNNSFIPFDDLIVPQVEALANQAAVLFDNLRLYDELDKLFDSLVRYSSKAIDARDPCTAGHSERVSQYAVDVAKSLGCFNENQLKELKYASFFHDIGKIGVREDVLTKENKLYTEQMNTIYERFLAIKQSFIIESLKYSWPKEKLDLKLQETDQFLSHIEKINKPTPMSNEDMNLLKEIYSKTYINGDEKPRKYLLPYEYENLAIQRGNLNNIERINIESHVKKSFDILSQIPFPPNLAKIPEIVCKHHEKIDGSGYPYGCKDQELPVEARILSVVDVYDALTAQDRPYKKPLSNEQAFSILDVGVLANHFDREIVETLKKIVGFKK